MSRTTQPAPIRSTRPRSGRVAAVLASVLLAGMGASCEETPAEVPKPGTLGVDVAVSQTVGAASVAEGALASFTVRVRNNGPAPVTGVGGLDSLSAGLTYESQNITGRGSFDPVSKVWVIDQLGVGEEVALTIFARANAGTAGSTQSNVMRIAVVSPDFTDTTATNNRAAATVTVTGTAAPSEFTNQPPGMTVLCDWHWTTHEGCGWRYEGDNPVTGAFQSVVTSGFGTPDPTGETSYLQATYVPLSPGGSGSGRTYFSIPTGRNEIFIAFWHKYAADYIASDNIGGNKMWFVMMGNNRTFTVFSDIPTWTPRRSYEITMSNFGPAPVNTSIFGDPKLPIEFGVWYKVEWYLKQNTPGQANGIMRHWINGQLVHEWTDLQYPGPFTNFYFEGTNNGIHLPTASDPRKIPGVNHWWVGRVLISAK